MKIRDKNLTSEFEIDAVWSFNEYSDQGIIGTLKYSQNKITVELPNSEFDISEEFNRVYGRTHANIITLFNVHVIRKRDNHLSYTKIIADYMFIDYKPIENMDNLQLKLIQFSFDYLPLFFKKNIWNNDRDTNSIIKTPIETKGYNIDSLNAILYEKYSSGSRANIESEDGLITTLKTHPYLEIKYAEKKSILEIKDDINKLRNLFTIICGEALTLTYFSYKSKTVDLYGKLMPVYSRFYFSQTPVERRKKQFTAAYKYSDVIDDFDNLLSNYFKYYKKLQPIIQNITVNLARKNLVETQFDDAITCLEVYHREFYKEYNEVSKEKEKTKQQIIELIESNHESESEREEIKEVVRDMDRVNLNKRVKQLFKDLPNELREKIQFKEFNFTKMKEINGFSYKCSLTRNYHAHGSTDSNENIFIPADQIYVSRILNIVSEYFMMKQIGLKENIIIKSICNKKDYQVVLKSLYSYELPN